MRRMGDKVAARLAAIEAGVQVVILKKIFQQHLFRLFPEQRVQLNQWKRLKILHVSTAAQ